jgi:arylsulfatase A-like enzyme
MRDTTPTHHTDMNRVFDWEVEQIVKALKAADVYQDTIIILSSDNGGLWDPVAEKAGHLSNGGVRGTKNHPWEGGHLVPLIVTWPDVIEPNTRSDALINGTDIIATLAEIVGTRLLDSQAKDSYSFLPLLKGDPTFQARDEVMLQAGAQCELMLRQGDWKLVMQSDWQLSKMEPIALFNLADNPQEKETRNLIHNPEYAPKLKAMHARYISVRNNPNRTVPLP